MASLSWPPQGGSAFEADCRPAPRKGAGRPAGRVAGRGPPSAATAELLADGSGVLTHCNAGGLATADYGTALAVFFAAQEAGKQLHVYADETRPLLQGESAFI